MSYLLVPYFEKKVSTPVIKYAIFHTQKKKTLFTKSIIAGKVKIVETQLLNFVS